MATRTRDIIDFREVLMRLVVRDIKSGTRKAMLSYGWVVIEAVLATGVFTFLMRGILGIEASDQPYPIFVYTGLLFWLWFSSALTASANSLFTYRNLVQQVYFPREYLVMAPIVGKLINFGISAVLLGVMMVIFQVTPHLELLWVVFLMFVAQLMLMSGLGFLLAPLNLAYRDISNMLPLVLPLFLFITPVVFAGDQVPERFQFLNVINPMALIIEISRGALLDGTVPASSEIALVFGIASAFMLVGYLVFRVVEPIFADIV